MHASLPTPIQFPKFFYPKLRKGFFLLYSRHCSYTGGPIFFRSDGDIICLAIKFAPQKA